MTESLADFSFDSILTRSGGVDARFDGAKLGGELVSIAHWRSHVRISETMAYSGGDSLRHEGRSAFRCAGAAVPLAGGQRIFG